MRFFVFLDAQQRVSPCCGYAVLGGGLAFALWAFRVWGWL